MMRSRPQLSWPSTLPLRPERSASTSPRYFSSINTERFITGSSRMGCAPAMASRNAPRAAILNASSEESTACSFPSWRLAATSIIGYPARKPSSMASCTPFSIATKYPLEIPWPLSVLLKRKPEERARGWKSIKTLPYCPCPPVCFLWVYSASAALVMVSRYLMRGGLVRKSILAALNLSRIIDICSSPSVERMVSLVSWW